MNDEPMRRDEIAAVARNAGLALPPAYDELLSAYGHVRAMIARLPDDRPRGDEPAHVFDSLRFAPVEDIEDQSGRDVRGAGPVAMINGPAVGSGMDMALHCDIRVGCEKTRFIAYHNAGRIIETR